MDCELGEFHSHCTDRSHHWSRCWFVRCVLYRYGSLLLLHGLDVLQLPSPVRYELNTHMCSLVNLGNGKSCTFIICRDLFSFSHSQNNCRHCWREQPALPTHVLVSLVNVFCITLNSVNISSFKPAFEYCSHYYQETIWKYCLESGETTIIILHTIPQRIKCVHRKS